MPLIEIKNSVRGLIGIIWGVSPLNLYLLQRLEIDRDLYLHEKEDFAHAMQYRTEKLILQATQL